MSTYFITHAEPLHPTKGKKVLFVVREQDENKARSHVVVKEIPHYFYTEEQPAKDAAALLTEIRKHEELKHLTFRNIAKNGTNRRVLRAEGSKEDRLVLPEEFICNGKTDHRDSAGLNSPSRLLRWFYPPFLQVNSPHDIPLPYSREYNRRLVSLESVLRDSHAVFDIETEDWEIGKDHIFMVTYRSPRGNIVFHDLPFEECSLGGITLVRFGSPQDLGEKLTALICKEDPLWIFGHNVMNFDNIKIRDLTGEFYPAVNGHYPVTKTSIGLGRVLTKGRWTLDTYLYHRNYRNVRADVKLETLADFDKTISYGEQAELVKKARRGDRAAFVRLIAYGVEDGLKTEKEALQIQEAVARKALHYRTSPDIICSTSGTTVALENWERRYFLINQFPDIWKRKNALVRIIQRENSFNLDQEKKSSFQEHFRRGFFEQAEVLYLTPFVAGCRELLEQKDREHTQRFRQSNEPLEKYDILHFLNQEITFLIEETAKILERENQTLRKPPRELSRWQEKAFYALCKSHGLRIDNSLQFVHYIARALIGTDKAVAQYDVVNSGARFHFVTDNIDVKRLESGLYGCSLGRGPVLSISRGGSAVANPFHSDRVSRFVYQGLGLKSAGSTNFERRVLTEILEKVFWVGNITGAKKYLEKEVETFIAGKSAEEDYGIPASRRIYYRDQLEELLGQVDRVAYNELREIRPRIGSSFSPETRARLREIAESCREYAVHPDIMKMVESIENPFPNKINLIYVAGSDKPLPPEKELKPDLKRYEDKVSTAFADLSKTLEAGKNPPRQLRLGI